MNEKISAALYIRVSTEDQLEYSPDAQRKLLLEYAHNNHLQVEDEYIFIDEGISGRMAEKRPAFLEMIALAKSKEKPFQKILVWKFSRFARNQQESILYKNMLKKDGIDVISISEPIIDGPFGELIERIIEWMDEYYSIRLSGEVMRGMREKAERGIPQNEAPYGYKLINHKYEIVPDEAEIIKFIFQEVSNGSGLTRICHKLLDMNIKSRRGSPWIPKRIKYTIQNPIYIGKVRWNYSTHIGGRKVNDPKDWIIVDGEQEPIIDVDTFNKANEVIDKATIMTTTRPGTATYKHWLSGLLRCSSCGTTLVLCKQTRKNGFKYSYRCNNYNKGACKTSNYISLTDIEKIVKEQLKDDFELLKVKQDALTIVKKAQAIDKHSIIKTQLEKLKIKFEKAKEAYLAGVDTLEEYKINKDLFTKEELKLKKQLSQTQEVTPQEVIMPKFELALDFIENDEVDNEKKNTILKSFIDKIVINRAKGTIEFYYYW